jgi:hypothetical protein
MIHSNFLEIPAAWGCVAIIPVLIPLCHWSFSCMAYSSTLRKEALGWFVLNAGRFQSGDRCHIPEDIFIVTAMRSCLTVRIYVCGLYPWGI